MTLLGLGALALAAEKPALAQDPGAVPKGAAGAGVAPEDDKPKPKRDISTAIPPVVTHAVAPAYPREAEAAGLEAEVIVALSIDKEGHVIKATLATPATPAGHGFDEAALDAAKQLAFTPAHWPDGTPFAAAIKYRFNFRLMPKVPTPDEAKAAEQKKVAVLSGVVLVRGPDAPIAGARVVLSPGDREALTDEKGAFSFPDLAPGRYSVVVSAAGFKSFGAEETLAAGEGVDVKYRLQTSGGAIEVTVDGERPPREVTKRTLDQHEIERIPGTNGDALKSLQSLPGVARPPSILGLLIVRGSAPQDTQTFIDGTPVPIIYHFGGFSSVVPTEVLKKIDFYPGNFGNEYGRVQAGIVDVGLRNPKPEFHGLAQADFFDVRLLAEGPIPKSDGWTFLVAGRRSIIGELIAPVLSAAGAAVTAAPVYYDYQLVVAKKPTPDSTFRVSFLGSDDSLQLLLYEPAPGSPSLSGDFGLHTAFQRLQMKYTNDLSNGDHANALLAFGGDQIGISLGSIFFDLSVRSISGRLEYGKKLGRMVTLNVGADMYGGYYDVNVQLPPPPVPGQPPSGPFGSAQLTSTHLTGGFFQPAVYVEAEVTPDARTRLVPGVRVDYFNVDKQVDVAPRVNGRYAIVKDFPRTTLKAGMGLYYQPPQFQEISRPFGNPNLLSNRSTQYDVGVEQDITKHIEVSLEAFYKRLDNQVVSTPSASGASVVYSNAGTGRVGGGELLLKYRPDDHFFGWVAYTLSRSVRTDGPGQQEQLFEYDQPHILTVLGSYDFKNGWEFGARFRLISGSPTTPNVCDPTQSTCVVNRTNALFAAATGTYTPIPVSGPFTERLPLFHALDLRVDRKWAFKSWTLRAYLDIQNVYNQANVEGISYNYNYTGRQYVSGLPIIPSLGIRAEL